MMDPAAAGMFGGGAGGLSLGKKKSTLQWSKMPLQQKMWFMTKNVASKVESLKWIYFPVFFYMCWNADSDVRSQDALFKIYSFVRAIIPLSVMR